MQQKIEPLTAEDSLRVEAQRSWVRDHYEPQARRRYDTVEGKLVLLETILKQGWIEPGETLKLQCLGITFGDVLAQELGLVWVAVEDDRGRDPALKDPGSSIVTFPLTAISKRIERDEPVDVRELLARARATISRLRLELAAEAPPDPPAES